jgi:hypothetical protein
MFWWWNSVKLPSSTAASVSVVPWICYINVVVYVVRIYMCAATHAQSHACYTCALLFLRGRARHKLKKRFIYEKNYSHASRSGVVVRASVTSDGLNVSFFYVLQCMYCTAAVVQVGRKQDVVVCTVSKQPPVQVVGRAVLFNQSWYRLPAVAGYLTLFFFFII